MEEIKCQCKVETCEMQININNEADNVVWVEVEGVQINVERLINICDPDGWVTTHVPFALDINGVVELIHRLQDAVIDKVSRQRI